MKNSSLRVVVAILFNLGGLGGTVGIYSNTAGNPDMSIGFSQFFWLSIATAIIISAISAAVLFKILSGITINNASDILTWLKDTDGKRNTNKKKIFGAYIISVLVFTVIFGLTFAFGVDVNIENDGIWSSLLWVLCVTIIVGLIWTYLTFKNDTSELLATVVKLEKAQ